MKSTLSIFAAVVSFSTMCTTAAAERYSLWPRRPAELEQARRLIKEHKAAEAARILQPLLEQEGIAGREARQMVAAANAPLYLSRRHPGAAVYTVRRGDHLARVAAALHCPYELLMLLNGLVDPSAIHVGQKLVYVPMNQRVEISLPRREIAVWDGTVLVASYDIRSVEGMPAGVAEEETKVVRREGAVEGGKVPAHSPLMVCANRTLAFGNGMVLAAAAKPAAKALRLEQADLNELALLVVEGTPVHVTYTVVDIPEAAPADKQLRHQAEKDFP